MHSLCQWLTLLCFFVVFQKEQNQKYLFYRYFEIKDSSLNIMDIVCDRMWGYLVQDHSKELVLFAVEGCFLKMNKEN